MLKTGGEAADTGDQRSETASSERSRPEAAGGVSGSGDWGRRKCYRGSELRWEDCCGAGHLWVPTTPPIPDLATSFPPTHLPGWNLGPQASRLGGQSSTQPAGLFEGCPDDTHFREQGSANPARRVRAGPGGLPRLCGSLLASTCSRQWRAGSPPQPRGLTLSGGPQTVSLLLPATATSGSECSSPSNASPGAPGSRLPAAVSRSVVAVRRSFRAFSPPRRGLHSHHGSAAREAGRREPVPAAGAGEHGAGGAHGAGGPGLQRAAQGAARLLRCGPAARRVCRLGWGGGPDREGPRREEETGPFGTKLGGTHEAFLGRLGPRVKFVKICKDMRQPGLKWDSGVRQRCFKSWWTARRGSRSRRGGRTPGSGCRDWGAVSKPK